MIGQTNLQNRIEQLIKNDTFPRFSIFVGPSGSGKKTFVREHFDGIYLENNKVESVRKMITLVYKVSNQIFIMPDADDMSNAARNALLKIIEECPNDNTFIMTLEDESNTLETIKSRGTIFHMDRYTSDEIRTYHDSKWHSSEEYTDLIVELCETPGDVDLIQTMGEPCSVDKFCDFVNLVLDNITTASISNVFKIADKIAIKNEDGFDLKLFWKAFRWACMDRSMGMNIGNSFLTYFYWINITAKYLQQLKNKGVNKQMLFDNWILSIRNVDT